ncbi:hypothetical protein [Streptomyces glaucus]|uniref:Integral membrane protein n=1 Tax=Streptomyces glaucus TaxID=284029 RepID=A0ABP5WEP0_9ACTN
MHIRTSDDIRRSAFRIAVAILATSLTVSVIIGLLARIFHNPWWDCLSVAGASFGLTGTLGFAAGTFYYYVNQTKITIAILLVSLAVSSITGLLARIFRNPWWDCLCVAGVSFSLTGILGFAAGTFYYYVIQMKTVS